MRRALTVTMAILGCSVLAAALPAAGAAASPAAAPMTPVVTSPDPVKPFTLRRAAQFRPPPPPALTSAKYAAAINEVKALGAGGALLLPSLWLLYRAFRRHTTEVTR